MTNKSRSLSDPHRAARRGIEQHNFFRRGGLTGQFHDSLSGWAGATGLPPAPANGEDFDFFTLFEKLEKDDPDGRRRINQLILDGLKGLNAKVLSGEITSFEPDGTVKVPALT